MEENFEIKELKKGDKFYLFYGSIFVVLVVLTNVIGAKLFQTPFKIGENLFSMSGFDVLTTGIITYPLTFLVTDVVSEIWGARRANLMVIMGFLMSLLMLLVVKIAVAMPASGIWAGSVNGVDPDQFHFLHETNTTIVVDESALPENLNAQNLIDSKVVKPVENQKVEITMMGAQSAFASVFAMGTWLLIGSMTAYLVAQFIDVQLYHFWKHLTKGKHLWLRNNGSTMFSQLVDTAIVNSFLFYGAFGMDFWLGVKIMTMIYIYKMMIAVLDTPFIYLFVYLTKKWLGIEQKTNND